MSENKMVAGGIEFGPATSGLVPARQVAGVALDVAAKREESMRKSLVAALDEISRCREVLREVQWSIQGLACPVCYGLEPDGHKPDCKLGLLILA